MRSGHGWKCGNFEDIPPLKDGWTPGWHSVRHHMGVTAFGINAVTAQKAGDLIIKEHDESGSNQQEVFFVHSGECEFMIDGEKCIAKAGTFVAIEPECKRSVTAIQAGSQLIVIGAPKDKQYQVPKWDTL